MFGSDCLYSVATAILGSSGADRARLEQVGAVLDGMHFLDFCTKPSFVFLRKYYTLSEEAQWCPRVMPSTLLAECPL